MTTWLVVRRFMTAYGRNATNVLLLLVIPVVFVLAAAPALADAARLLGGASGGGAVETVTAGWAASFLSAIAMYFQIADSRLADRRLTGAGLSRGRLVAARLVVGAGLAGAASLVALLALALRHVPDDPWRVAAGTALFALIYMGIGAVVGAIVPTAINGTVVLLFIWILDVFFGPTLSGTDAWIVRLLPTHFVSLWMVNLSAGHPWPDELTGSLIWTGLALLGAVLVVGRSASPAGNHRSPAGGRVAQLLTGLRMGWRDWRRVPTLWVLLAVVPAVFILLSDAITPHGQSFIRLREAGRAYTAMVDPADIHAGTMAPIAIASLAALAGALIAVDARPADRRLALAGARLGTLLAVRLTVVLTAAGLATVVSLLVAATVFTPDQWWVYATGNLLLAVIYGFIGVCLGPVFGRVSSVFLAFLIPFLDVGIWQSPMLRGEPAEWARWLPGYGGVRVVLDGALTASFDELTSLIAALGWTAVFLVLAILVLKPRTYVTVSTRGKFQSSEGIFG